MAEPRSGQNFALTPGQSNADLLDWNSKQRADFVDYTALACVDGILYAVWADNANAPVPNSCNGTSYLDIYMAYGTPPSP